MRPTSAVLTASAVMALALASACTGDPEPRTVDPSSSSTAPAAEGVPAPTGSDTAEPQSLSPVQTVEAWVEAYNEMLSSGDADEIRSLSAATCVTCDQVIGAILNVHRDGGRFVGGLWAVDAAEKDPTGTGEVVVRTGVTIQGGQTYPSKGADPVTYRTTSEIQIFRLRRSGAGWEIAFNGIVE